jgi:hypothetical protein
MGSNGRNLMRQRYNWPTIAQRIATLIERGGATSENAAGIEDGLRRISSRVN